MFDLQVEAIKAADQLQRRRRASTDDANGSVKFPAAGGFLEGIEDANPDGGDTAGNCNALAGHQSKYAFRIDMGAGKNQASAEHGARVREAPGIGMEHGSDGQNGVKAANAKDFVEATCKGVQDQRAVRINDAFRIPRGAGGEAHGGAVVFVDLRIAEIVAGFGEELFVIQVAFGNGIAAIGHDDDVLMGNIFGIFFEERHKDIINQEEAVVGRFGDGSNF